MKFGITNRKESARKVWSHNGLAVLPTYEDERTVSASTTIRGKLRAFAILFRKVT